MFEPDRPGPEYELAWPRELFVTEALVLLRSGRTREGDPELLLREAFSSDVPAADYNSAAFDDLGDAMNTWLAGTSAGHQTEFLRTLVESADRLPTQSHPRPYWRQRQGIAERVARPTPTDPALQIQVDWTHIVNDLQERGYLDRLAPRPCVDDRGQATAPSDVIKGEIARRTGVPTVWPPRPWLTRLASDDFFELIEVVHDLVARPRSRSMHDFGDCGWHYSAFAAEPGRALYRARVNEVLARNEIGLQLAGDGEDVGRLVRVPGDARRELLVDAARRSASPAVRKTTEHAIALFRARSASRDDKRSACIALVGILEERRGQLRSELLTNDERVLFRLANEFAVRHRNADQRADYDEEYLDWLFWWYLATVDLTNKLLERTAPKR